MSFVTYDLICDDCEYVTDYMFDISTSSTIEEIDSIVNNSVECPNCEKMMRRAFLTFPNGGVKGSYDQEISKMKQSFHKRFMRPESQDEMRNKFGNLYDASLRGGAVDKAQKLAEKAFVKTDEGNN